MKFSRFNLKSVIADSVMITNTHTGAVITLSIDEYDELQLRPCHNNNESGIPLKLMQSGFIVKDDVDEISMLKYLYNYAFYINNYLDLRVLPTEKCNFRCTYWYEKFIKGEMSAEDRNRSADPLYSRFIKIPVFTTLLYGNKYTNARPLNWAIPAWSNFA